MHELQRVRKGKTLGENESYEKIFGETLRRYWGSEKVALIQYGKGAGDKTVLKD